MEMLSIGFLVGALTAIIFVGIGVCFGRLDNKKSGNDNDVRIYHPSADRKCRCVDRYSAEEMTNVLKMLKHMTSGYERKVMNRIIELVEKEGINGI